MHKALQLEKKNSWIKVIIQSKPILLRSSRYIEEWRSEGWRLKWIVWKEYWKSSILKISISFLTMIWLIFLKLNDVEVGEPLTTSCLEQPDSKGSESKIGRRVYLFKQYSWKLQQILRFSSNYFCVFLTHLNRLSKTKAIGLGGISARLIRDCADIISSPLCDQFNKSLMSGIFPDYWIFARVTPSFKKGDSFYINDYRPTSVISVVAKVFERIV